MAHLKSEYLRHIQTFNKGFWLAARIYSDVKDNKCSCGGTFSSYKEIKKIPYPVCAACGETPPRLRIRAKVQDAEGVDRYIFVRHTQYGERLKDLIDCLGVLKRVEEELESGEFDLKRYDSKKNRERLKFEHFALKEYLPHFQNAAARGEITPAGLRAKEKYVKVLLEHFTGKDLARVNYPAILQFKDKFTDKLRTRDLALGELKTLLRRAKKLDLINKVPEFDPIPVANKRVDIPDIHRAREVALTIENPVYRTAIYCLTVYPVRPSELRAVKRKRDIDFEGMRIFFRSHFSDDVLLDGRKSVSGKQKEAELEFPIIKELQRYLLDSPPAIGDGAFLFPGANQAHISESVLVKVWRKALIANGLKPYGLYDLRHARITEIEELLKNKHETIKYSGHTNVQTLKRYDHSKDFADPVFASYM